MREFIIATHIIVTVETEQIGFFRKNGLSLSVCYVADGTILFGHRVMLKLVQEVFLIRTVRIVARNTTAGHGLQIMLAG